MSSGYSFLFVAHYKLSHLEMLSGNKYFLKMWINEKRGVYERGLLLVVRTDRFFLVPFREEVTDGRVYWRITGREHARLDVLVSVFWTHRDLSFPHKHGEVLTFCTSWPQQEH